MPPQERDGPIDDMNPRALTTPLQITLEPYWCPICVKEERIKDVGVHGAASPPPGAPAADVPAAGVPAAGAPGDGAYTTPYEMHLMKRPVAKLAEQLSIKLADIKVMETAHFKIFSMLDDAAVKYADSIYVRADLDRLKKLGFEFSLGPDGARLDAHTRMHMYHVRLERQYAHFTALTGNTKPNLGMALPYEIYLWSDYTPHHEFVDRFIGGRNDKGGVQWHFRDPPNYEIFSCAESIVTAQVAKGDGALANHLFHNVAHLMADGYNNYLRETPAWIEEGLGHYYERRENPRWNTFCWAEGKPPTDFTKPNWESIIFTIVRRGKDTPFNQWCEKLQPGEMTGVENGLSWSIVKWLIETEPVRFTKMLEAMHDQVRNLKPGELIQDAFGCSSGVLYQRWREYVLKEYAGK